jgi:hypothetical protein
MTREETRKFVRSGIFFALQQNLCVYSAFPLFGTLKLPIYGVSKEKETNMGSETTVQDDRDAHSENIETLTAPSQEQTILGALGASVLIRGVPAQLIGGNMISRKEDNIQRIWRGRPNLLVHGLPVASSVGLEIPRNG